MGAWETPASFGISREDMAKQGMKGGERKVREVGEDGDGPA